MFWLSQLLQWTGSAVRKSNGARGRPGWRDRRHWTTFAAPRLEPLEDRRMLSLLGQQIFPADYPWNQDISNAPVAANSASIIAHISGSSPPHVHPDWGDDDPANGTDPLYGIPYNVVHGKTTAKISVIIDNYPGESDIVSVPIPAGAVVEGDYQNGPNPNGGGYDANQRGDSHLIVWDEDSNTAYELYGVTRPSDPNLFPDNNGDELPHTDGLWHAASETVWHMNTDNFRTLGYTSADAAGLSILAGLARPDEGLTVAQGGQGVINHALRMTLPAGDVNWQYIYPGSHIVNHNQSSSNLPMGARLRLANNTTVNNLINAMPPESKIIAQAMQKYGLVLADIGTAMYVTGSSASQDANNNIAHTWNMDNDILASNGLKVLTAADFEVVNLAPIVTRLSATSGVANSTILVNGQNFSGAAGNLSVFFGNVASNSVTVLTDKQLSVVVPSGVGTVDVTVQSGINETDNVSSNPNANVNKPIFGYGTSATSSADQFTFTGGAQWTNGASTLKWTDALNWNPSGAPGSSTDAFFGSTGLSTSATVNFNGAQTARSLAFQGTVNFTLGGTGSLTLGTGYLTRSPGAAGTQTIAQPVILGANATWDIAGSGQLIVSSAISGPFSLTKQGPGTLTLSGSNSYSQGTVVTAGKLIVSNANAILSGSNLTVGSGALALDPPVPMIEARSASENSRPAQRIEARCASEESKPAPRIERFSRPSATTAMAADLAWRRVASSSDDLDQRRQKDIAILALEALFAGYGR